MSRGEAWMQRASAALAIIGVLLAPVAPARADLRTAPVWYDQNAVAATPDWHYRVPVTIAAGNAVNSTVKVDVDFAALLLAMNVSGTFDVNSPRVVRSTGTLATTQEYTDRIYAGATDAVGNSRGEVRFILEDAGAVTYYIYFDVTANGAKPVNPQTPINGNFERGATGTAQPTGWNAPTKTNANYNAEVRPSESVSVTANPTPAVDGVNTRTTDGTPNTGDFSYLLGWRNSTAAQVNGAPGATFTRTITVPASNPGNLVFRYRVEGWDSYDLGTGFDFLRADIVGTATTEMVGPTAGSYNSKPFSPNYGASAASNTVSGYRRYNGYDCNLAGAHTNGGTLTCGSEVWITVTQSLAAFAGQTVTLRFRAFTETQDITWYHIDDVEWSVSAGTLGAPQAFGVNITSPAAGAGFAPGQAIPVTAQVDAAPTASTNPVFAQLYDATGTLVAGGPYLLYNDGTHGDVTAGDAVWSNNNSLPAQPAPTIPGSATTTTGWTLRVWARDTTTNTAGGTNGVARIGGQPAAETQADYWNIDDSAFNVAGANIVLAKSSSVVSDPVNGTTNPKAIPGATMRYCLLVTNNGPAAAGSIVATDTLPAGVSYVAGSMRSGATCATAATVEDDDNTGADESDPVGASYSSGTLITVTATLANAATLALTFDVVIP